MSTIHDRPMGGLDAGGSGADPLSGPDLPFTVAVVEDDPRVRTRLAMQLAEVVRAGSYPSIAALVEKASSSAMVVIFGPSYSSPEGLTEMSDYVRERAGLGVVLVVDELSTQLLQQAIRAGVADVITIPQDARQLIEAVDRAAEHLNLASAGPMSTAVAPGGGSGERGRVITVFSTKGGAGKSFVATNLAVLLARRSERPVCLVDCDLQFGDVAVMLKLVPQHTIVDAINSMSRLDVPLVRSLLVRHDPSGLLVMPGPTEPAFADSVKAEDVIEILNAIRTFCAYIVVDTPSYFTEVVIRLLEESEDIVLVAGMDVPNIKNVKLGINTLKLLELPLSKVKLVLNRSNSKVKIDVSEVERALGLKADCLVPSDITVPQSINKGLPAALDAPRSGPARALESLADLFSEPANAQKGRR